MNGMETFYALKAIDAGVKVLLISGYSFTEEARALIEDGAAGFLVKPVTAQEFLRAIATTISGAGKRASPVSRAQTTPL